MVNSAFFFASKYGNLQAFKKKKKPFCRICNAPLFGCQMVKICRKKKPWKPQELIR
jgi:hypothetical protein